MAKHFDIGKVLEVLRARNFEELLEVAEDDCDFKGAPYHVDAEAGQRDLAEDVAKFANAAGGVLVLGVETVLLEGQPVEVAKRIRPFPADRLIQARWRGLIDDWIIPRPERVEIEWYESARGTEGLGVVVVPSQPEALKPFLVKKAYVSPTGKTLGNYVGYFERVRSGTATRSAEDLQRLLGIGLRHQEMLAARLDEIAEQLAELLEGRESLAAPLLPGPTLVDAGNRRGEAIRDAGLNDVPTFSLICTPHEAVTVPDIFAGPRNPLIRLLAHPPELRDAGFDITADERVDVIRRELRRSVIEGYKVLELRRDGILIFAARADELPCLGRRRPEHPELINPLALAETTFLFAELSRRVAEHFQPRPTGFGYAMGFHRMTIDGRRATLVPGPRKGIEYQWTRNIRPMPDENNDLRIPWPHPEINPGRVAFLLLRELYAWFGFTEEQIPYVPQPAPGREPQIDPELIKRDGEPP